MRTSYSTTRELDELYSQITTQGLCVTLGPDDSRWLPDIARPLSRHRREELSQAAAAACDGCPVIDQCGRWALATGQQYGIWGGMPEHELAEIRVARRRSLRQIARQEAA